MPDEKKLPPLTAETFDVMMEDIQRARRAHASLVLDAAYDRRLAAELSLEVLRAQSRVAEEHVRETACEGLFAREQKALPACLAHLSHVSIDGLLISNAR